MEVKGQPYPRIFAQHFHIILQNPASAFAETGFFYSLKQIDFLSAYFFAFFRKEYIMKKETDF